MSHVATYFLLLTTILCMRDVSSQTSFNANLSKGPRLNLGLEHTSRSGRWKFSGSGWTDFHGNWGGGLGVSFRFRKRSVKLPKSYGGRFYLVIRTDPCDFKVYDKNSDGVITKEEMFELFFPDRELTNKLMLALDVGSEDGKISEDEFKSGAEKFIQGCQIIQTERIKTLLNTKQSKNNTSKKVLSK